MNFLDLFSGIGGFALGAEWAGMQFDAHYYSEVDPYAIKVYEKRFPGAISLGDIRSIRGTDLPAGDWIIAGGFPCQDISVAGKGAGLAGERSGLWFEYARLIGELRPRYAIMENVGALAFRGLDRVLGSLSALGYDAEWQDIRASDVGAPHRRERIWIVAYPMCDGRYERRPECAGQFGRPSPLGASSQTLADASILDAQGNEPGEPDQKGRTQPGERPFGSCRACTETLADSTHSGDVRRDGELEPAQGQVREHRGSAEDGRREWWTAEPDVGRVAHGLPSRVDRLKCLGNSIVPQIAELIFRQIKQL